MNDIKTENVLKKGRWTFVAYLLVCMGTMVFPCETSAKGGYDAEQEDSLTEEKLPEYDLDALSEALNRYEEIMTIPQKYFAHSAAPLGPRASV